MFQVTGHFWFQVSCSGFRNSVTGFVYCVSCFIFPKAKWKGGGGNRTPTSPLQGITPFFFAQRRLLLYIQMIQWQKEFDINKINPLRFVLWQICEGVYRNETSGTAVLWKLAWFVLEFWSSGLFLVWRLMSDALFYTADLTYKLIKFTDKLC